MKLNLTIALLCLLIGYCIAKETTFYKLSCDTDKYGYMWISEVQLIKNPFECKEKNHILAVETNPTTIFKLLKLEIGIYEN